MSESSSEDKEARRGVLERHFHTLALSLITAGVVYLGSFVVQAREDAVRSAAQQQTTTQQLVALTAEVAGLRAQLSAMQVSYVPRDDFKDHETRIRHLEGRRP